MVKKRRRHAAVSEFRVVPQTNRPPESQLALGTPYSIQALNNTFACGSFAK